MILELERELWNYTRQDGRDPFESDRTPRKWIGRAVEVGKIENEKQAWRTLEKWADAGVYNFGVAVDLGWLERGAEFPRVPQPRAESEGDQ